MNTKILLLTLQALVLCVAGKTEKDCECDDPPVMLLFGIAMGISYIVINHKNIFQHPSGQRNGLGGFHTGEDYYSDDEEDSYESEKEEEYEGAEADSDGEETEGEEPEEEEEEEDQQVRSSTRLRRRNV